MYSFVLLNFSTVHYYEYILLILLSHKNSHSCTIYSSESEGFWNAVTVVHISILFTIYLVLANIYRTFIPKSYYFKIINIKLISMLYIYSNNNIDHSAIGGFNWDCII